MEETIKITVAGPRGKMGKACVEMVASTSGFQLVSVLDRINDGKRLNEIDPQFSRLPGVPVFTEPEKCLADTKPDVFIDLTRPEAAFSHTRTALSFGVRAVVGTTGLTDDHLAEIKALADRNAVGCIIAPNFSLGAVLMMKFARMAAKFFPDVEIIELHHDQKRDAPSGTSIQTARMILEERGAKKQGHPEEKELMAGARGAQISGIPVHSVRLPGLIAHQEVIFGSRGETLTIRHDSYDRKSFMRGIETAVRAVMALDRYVYGMENLLQ